MSKSKPNVKKYLNFRNVLILLIFLVVSILWFKYIAGIVLVAAFAPLTVFIIKCSKMVPHVTADINLAVSCLIGFLYGGFFGLGYGFMTGLFSLVMASHVKITSLASVLLAALSGMLCGFLHSGTHLSFGYAFIIVAILRTIVAWPLFAVLGTDPFENFTHQTSQLLINLIIYLPLFSLLYSILSTFIGG